MEAKTPPCAISSLRDPRSIIWPSFNTNILEERQRLRQKKKRGTAKRKKATHVSRSNRLKPLIKIPFLQLRPKERAYRKPMGDRQRATASNEILKRFLNILFSGSVQSTEKVIFKIYFTMVTIFLKSPGGFVQ
jgi:hypothetical protein